MKLAVSNIAWTSADDEVAYRLLAERGVLGLEIAPSRIWAEPDKVTSAAASAFRVLISSFGLSVVAFQAILFGQPELTIFDARVRGKTLDYLKRQCDLAARLGVKALVFGSPKNRLRGDLPPETVFKMALDFFAELGRYADRLGVHVCLEPNPPDYGADFLTTIEETIRLVAAVDSMGIRLHFDTGGMHLSGEDAAGMIQRYASLAIHFHASEPYLQSFAAPVAEHAASAAALRQVGFKGYVSMEMRAMTDGLSSVSHAIDFISRIYGDA
jgi:D-psicose/D-tagatose/L-ribulose 3-epimerase